MQTLFKKYELLTHFAILCSQLVMVLVDKPQTIHERRRRVGALEVGVYVRSKGLLGLLNMSCSGVCLSVVLIIIIIMRPINHLNHTLPSHNEL